ncbi:MAG: M20/M25/M40 family metallo-hydrolase [Sandaracinaceae bacterium]
MRTQALLVLGLLLMLGCDTPPSEPVAPPPSEPPAPSFEDTYRAPVGELVAASRESDFAWEWLETLCVDIGHRLSGSESLERAVDWSASELEGIEGVTVTRQEVTVPHWVRGNESLVLLGDTEDTLSMVGLGNSEGTPPGGIEGEVVVVDSLGALDEAGEALRGKVVLIDQAMPPYDEATFDTGYGATVSIRTRGPARAARHGALAVLIRSVTRDREGPPHTGVTRYEEGGPRIPGAALTLPDTDRLRALVESGARPRVRLTMAAETLPDATSHNIIAELPGTALPDEIVVFGGHIDSWDVGQGCHDDGAGVVSAMAALRLLAEQGLRPRRTVRAVLFTNEENGLAGGEAYAEAHWGDGLHIAGIESDIGAAPVIGLNLETAPLRESDGLEQLRALQSLLAPAGVLHARSGFGGSDVSPLGERGTPTVGLLHDPAHYFDLHHTAADTLEAVDRDAFLQGVAVMAATAYVLADMEPRLTNPR